MAGKARYLVAALVAIIGAVAFRLYQTRAAFPHWDDDDADDWLGEWQPVITGGNG